MFVHQVRKPQAAIHENHHEYGQRDDAAQDCVDSIVAFYVEAWQVLPKRVHLLEHLPDCPHSSPYFLLLYPTLLTRHYFIFFNTLKI